MRTASFQTRNNQTVEIFLERQSGHFELWVVGPKENRRVILNHYLTHDDLEARLRYAKSVLLAWKEAGAGDVPEAKSPTALEDEQTIDCGTFWDADELSDHLSGVATLDCDRTILEAAKTGLPGVWVDGASTLTFGTDSAFQCAVAASVDRGFLHAATAIAPNDWHLSDSWELRLMNRQTHRTVRRLVHQVSATELHLAGDGNCIAMVLKRKVV